ncbi:hypothetical protein RQP46_006062 [Phenoliferia psychrophenolica]
MPLVAGTSELNLSSIDIVVNLSKFTYGVSPTDTMIMIEGQLRPRPFKPWWREAPAAERENKLSHPIFDEVYGLNNVVEGVPGDRRGRAALADILASRQYILLEFLSQTIRFFCVSDKLRAEVLKLQKDRLPGVKVCGKALLDAVDVPTTGELASSDAPPTAGILRQFSLLSKHAGPMGFWTISNLEDRLMVLAPDNIANGRALRDTAIARRDVTSVAQFAIAVASWLLYCLPTRDTIRQIAWDFEVPFKKLSGIYAKYTREFRVHRLEALKREQHAWPTTGEYCSYCYQSDGALPEDFIACEPCVAAGFAVYYCSSECSAADEPSHRACCGQFIGHPLGHLSSDKVPPFTSESFETVSLSDGCLVILDVFESNQDDITEGFAPLWMTYRRLGGEIYCASISSRDPEISPGFARGEQLAILNRPARGLLSIAARARPSFPEHFKSTLRLVAEPHIATAPGPYPIQAQN